MKPDDNDSYATQDISHLRRYAFNAAADSCLQTPGLLPEGCALNAVRKELGITEQELEAMLRK